MRCDKNHQKPLVTTAKVMSVQAWEPRFWLRLSLLLAHNFYNIRYSHYCFLNAKKFGADSFCQNSTTNLIILYIFFLIKSSLSCIHLTSLCSFWLIRKLYCSYREVSFAYLHLLYSFKGYPKAKKWCFLRHCKLTKRLQITCSEI